MQTKYGFNPSMTLWLALRVMFWRVVKGETWRGIAYDFLPLDKNNLYDSELRSNQYYGLDVVEAASKKLKFKSHLIGVWN